VIWRRLDCLNLNPQLTKSRGLPHTARHRHPGRQGRKAVAGKVPVKRNQFITLTGDDKSVSRDLETKACTLAGWKSYVINITAPTAKLVIGAYHRLWRIEKSFGMCKHDVQAPPIYRHKRESIQAHLAVVSLPSRSPTRSRPRPVGRSSASFRPPEVTAPSPSSPADRPSPPRRRYPPSYATPSP
jgi:hypothetical protein